MRGTRGTRGLPISSLVGWATCHHGRAARVLCAQKEAAKLAADALILVGLASFARAVQRQLRLGEQLRADQRLADLRQRR
jgi:hypothetical protein